MSKGSLFLQLWGTALGAACANLLLGLWEREVFLTLPVKNIETLRYIDNILLIWQGPEKGLIEFINMLNTNLKRHQINVDIQ